MRFVPRSYSKVTVQEEGSPCYHSTINTCSEGINTVVPLPITPYDCRQFARTPKGELTVPSESVSSPWFDEDKLREKRGPEFQDISDCVQLI